MRFAIYHLHTAHSARHDSWFWTELTVSQHFLTHSTQKYSKHTHTLQCLYIFLVTVLSSHLVLMFVLFSFQCKVVVFFKSETKVNQTDTQTSYKYWKITQKNLQKLTEDQQKNTKTTKRKPHPKISKTRAQHYSLQKLILSLWQQLKTKVRT